MFKHDIEIKIALQYNFHGSLFGFLILEITLARLNGDLKLFYRNLKERRGIKGIEKQLNLNFPRIGDLENTFPNPSLNPIIRSDKIRKWLVFFPKIGTQRKTRHTTKKDMKIFTLYRNNPSINTVTIAP